MMWIYNVLLVHTVLVFQPAVAVMEEGHPLFYIFNVLL